MNDVEEPSDVRSEVAWIAARGGDEWLSRYVRPFYFNWMGEGATYRGEAAAQIPELRSRAGELPLDDLETMLRMQWRIQVMSAWYAIARADPGLTPAIHDGLAHCFGSLTAPALVTAALIYQDDRTADVLRRYRVRDVDNDYGSDGIVDAALRLVEGDSAGQPTEDDLSLAGMLAVAQRLQNS